ncbi:MULTISPECIES: NAD(P)/FAD-dependent oxidoreductase [unclassified Spirosoma]|uniref:NAD(P)/FAD-dependent oxidoreductase n=1 Tax=unclassified Spirosoma TaxID=2621999 RepID=UPI0009616E56|nr:MULTISPECIES: NAD(P)/FAD-dependent oxidoreductase [unclassified Spirosoma]MBN8821798.1 NAD(P)/FAD-dependent oxidoreductase [Spirosoma sp.]OJW80712.1 MAG: FAD-dependent oxidoreductase [Spirosoma sp. 48-14]
MNPNIPQTDRKRVVIVGAGFGGLKLARKLSHRKEFQVVLINKQNYHEFQPLYYQVATAGLEANSILFPLRAVFGGCKNVHIRVTTVTGIRTADKTVDTELGPVTYDYLVMATGADTNFFNQQNIIEKGLSMKSVSEAIALRNRMLQNFEDALSVETQDEREGLMDVVVVGGGPTGVELCGTLAEMRRTVLPVDYPELDFKMMDIFLIESGGELLGPMSVQSQEHSLNYLQELGVIVKLNTRVKDFDGRIVTMNDGSTLRTNNLIWAAGVKANPLAGLPPDVLGRGGRVLVNRYSQVQGFTDIFAIGDVALMTEEKWPNGHPQVAQPAIQQGRHLAKNLLHWVRNEQPEAFTYNDLGTMATIGRGLAVVDLPYLKFQGFFAWLTWLFVHLMSIVGVKNRLFIFLNWMVNYLTYSNSLRLIIKPKLPKGDVKAMQEKLSDQVEVRT